MTNVPLMRLEDVSKIYGNDGIQVTALCRTDLAIERGEFVCIAGPSGSGKTTLLNLIGLLDTPTTGNVFFEGRPIIGLNRSEKAKIRMNQIGFVFQAHNLIPVLSAYENVEYILLLKGFSARKRRELVNNALTSVGLKEMGKKKPGEMSGGEQQRVAAARAIVGCPSLVLADEPTASLDSANGEALVALFKSLSDAQGTTFIFSSHDPSIIARAGRVLTMHDGVIDGPFAGLVRDYSKENPGSAGSFNPQFRS